MRYRAKIAPKNFFWMYVLDPLCLELWEVNKTLL